MSTELVLHHLILITSSIVGQRYSVFCSCHGVHIGFVLPVHVFVCDCAECIAFNIAKVELILHAC
jgi:hypothetical protein